MSLGRAGEGDGGFGNAQPFFSSHSSTGRDGKSLQPHRVCITQLCAGLGGDGTPRMSPVRGAEVLGRSTKDFGQEQRCVGGWDLGQDEEHPPQQAAAHGSTAQQLEETFPSFTATSWDPRSELKVVAF